MKLTEEMVLNAFNAFIQSTMSRFNLSEINAYREAAFIKTNEVSLVALCMFMTGHLLATYSELQGNDIDFKVIKDIVTQRINLKLGN